MRLGLFLKLLKDNNLHGCESTSMFPRTEKERNERFEKARLMSIPQSPEKRLISVVKILESTSYLRLFFEKYDEMNKIIKQILDEKDAFSTCDYDVLVLVKKYNDIQYRTKVIKTFIDRAVTTNKENLLKQELWKYKDKMTQQSIDYAEYKLGPLTTPNKMDGDKYFYCLVEFDRGSNSYYYIADDYSITVGDKVIVPVGDYGKTSIAKVVKTEKFDLKEYPFPLEKTKRIIRKK